MNEKELNYKESWTGEYRGVRFEVVHWYLGWNYYLFVPVAQLPNETLQKLFNLRLKPYSHFNGKRGYYFDYNSKAVISSLDWHCGITAYAKARDDAGNVIGYRMGCDYMHYWDEGHIYCLESLTHDAKHSIDKLWELIPELKVRCAYNGEYYPENETYLTDKGVRVALINKDAWNKPIGTKTASE
jgi:hypothetical protein